MRVKLGKHIITISYPFAAMLALSFVVDRTGNAACCFAAALLHEAGHIAAILYMGGSNINIRLSVFDFNIKDRNCCMRTNAQQMLISAAGPFANILMFALFLPFEHTQNFAFANLIVGLFNLMPVESLDGGQIICIVICRFFSPVICRKIMTIITVIFILFVATTGYLVLIESGYNFTLLLIAVYLSGVLLFKPEHKM